MKRFSMIIASILLVGLLAALSITAGAATDPKVTEAPAPEEAQALEDMPQLPAALYLPFTGKVQEVQPFYEPDGTEREGVQYVLLQGADESLMRFQVDEKTVLLGDPVLEAGQELTGFYNGNAPAILIYPPQMPALVLMPHDPEVQASMALFDAEMLSADGQLKISTDEKTVIVDQRGEDFTGELAGRTLVVTYGPSTRSIPAQATAIRIVVLDEAAEEITAYQVNGEAISGPAAFQAENGTWMAPVAPIAEALDMPLVADETQPGTYHMGRAISFTLDSTTYTYARMAPIVLDTAPAEVDGEIYVPLDFFTLVARFSEAYVEGGEIVLTLEADAQ